MYLNFEVGQLDGLKQLLLYVFRKVNSLLAGCFYTDCVVQLNNSPVNSALEPL